MTQDSPSTKLTELHRQLDRLPKTAEPPPTTLQLLGQGRQEGDWQRYLAYLLAPNAPHGLEHAAVEQFLDGLETHESVEFEYSRFDLDDIQIDTEVPVTDGRLDLLLWSGEEWFILCELKIDSTEHADQTERYAQAESFGNFTLDPSAVPSDRQHYLYITPNGTAPASDEFVPITWSWIATQLRAVQESDYGGYPARTTSQLDDFIDTIDTELTMTDHERNETAKASLYVDYYSDISEVESAFESGWTDMIDTWGRRLATAIDDARLVEDPDGVPTAPEGEVHIELPDGDDRARYWLCRQGNGNWAWLFPTDWWTDLETGDPIYANESPNARIGFLHRPADDRDAVLEDHELRFYLRNAPSGNDEFYPRFAEKFHEDEKVARVLPQAAERRDRKSNVIEAHYPLEVDRHDSLFDAYIAALARAVDEHIVSNHELIARIDDLYETTLNEVDEGPS